MVKYLLDEHQPATTEDDLLNIDPNLNHKIKFNKLSESIATYLRIGNSVSGLIESYFGSNRVFHREIVKDILKLLYQESAKSYHNLPNKSA